MPFYVLDKSIDHTELALRVRANAHIEAYRGCTSVYCSDKDRYEDIAVDAPIPYPMESYETRDQAFKTITDPATHHVLLHLSRDEQNDWHRRELDRFDDGTYSPVPWGSLARTSSDPTRYHFAHLSVQFPGLVAFTPDDEYGIANRKKTLKPGRYLETFYKDHYTREVIAELIAMCSVDYLALQIAKTADDIERVYLGGPSSCMSHTADSYSSGMHPVRVYGESPDLALAYFGFIDKAAARSIVWPAKKEYTRIYGDTARMEVLLRKEGYKEGSIDGARIRRVEHGGGRYVMPYVDWVDGAEDDGEWIILGSGSIETDSTTGVASDGDCDRECHDRECNHCGSMYDPQDDDESSDDYCATCEESHSTCEECDRYVWAPRYGQSAREWHAVSTETATLCRGCADDEQQTCAIDSCFGTWYPRDLSSTTESDRIARSVADLCPECADDYQCCEHCDGYFDRDDAACKHCDHAVRCDATPSLPLPNDPDQLFGVFRMTPDGEHVPCFFGSSARPAIVPNRNRRRLDMFAARMHGTHPRNTYVIVAVDHTTRQPIPGGIR